MEKIYKPVAMALWCMKLLKIDEKQIRIVPDITALADLIFIGNRMVNPNYSLTEEDLKVLKTIYSHSDIMEVKVLLDTAQGLVLKKAGFRTYAESYVQEDPNSEKYGFRDFLVRQFANAQSLYTNYVCSADSF